MRNRGVPLWGGQPLPLVDLQRWTLDEPQALVFVVGALLVAAATSIQAQTPQSGSAPAQTSPSQRVTIVGTTETNDRQDALAAKLVVSREDIARFGDTSVADVLRRVPGVSVSGEPGRGREIRIRGLGSGYTQLQVNGEPVPAGFSIDAISPDLVERIEVIRTATADSSTQAIAGTVNIVLRAKVRTGQRELNATGATSAGLGSGSATGQVGDRTGTWSYLISSNLNYEREQLPRHIALEAWAPDGTSLTSRTTDAVDQLRTLTIGVTPRATWKPSEATTLTIDGLASFQRFDASSEEVRSTLSGAEPTFARNLTKVVYDSTLLRLSANWNSPIGENGRLNTRFTTSHVRRVSDGQLSGFDAGSTEILSRSVDSSLNDNSLAITGKYTLGLGEQHTVGAGWDGRLVRRREERIQRETSNVGFPTLDLDEDYQATVSGLAVYIQDEWSISKQLSSYLGVRWEALETRTRGTLINEVRSRSSVLSPTTQVIWKVPDTKADQVRLSVARTYKAPTARELIPRRWVVNDNSATSPNFQGNPGLAPELAWGLDLGFERHLPQDAFLGLNVYARRIQDVVLERVYFDATSNSWISTPTNSGSARVAGVEAEMKGRLRSLFSAAPDVDLRFGFTRNFSRVEGVPGPDNRLGRQPSLTATLGADYRLAATPVAIGGNFAFQKGDLFRSSASQTTHATHKRSLDMYSVWAVNKDITVRMSLLNLLRPDSVVTSEYEDSLLRQSQRTLTTSYRTIRLTLSMKL